jgi:hypothetical protein
MIFPPQKLTGRMQRRKPELPEQYPINTTVQLSSFYNRLLDKKIIDDLRSYPRMQPNVCCFVS